MIKKFLLMKLVDLMLVGTLWAQCIGISNPSNEVHVTIPATGGHQVALSWQPSTIPAVKYSVYRGLVSGGEAWYANDITGLSFTDTSVVDGKDYWYTVISVCIQAPGTPTGLTGVSQ